MLKKSSKYITLRELHLSKRIWWIDSFPTLRKWVEKDIAKKNYLQTIKKGSKTGTRFYFRKENVEKYIRAFEKGDF